MNKYVKPEASVVEVKLEGVIATSSIYEVPKGRRCDSSCKIWHTCRDRQLGDTCYDKRY